MVYADDMVLLAEAAQHLQSMLDCLHSWCLIRGMVINVQKTVAVTFRHQKYKKPSHTLSDLNHEAWSIAGTPVPIAQEFKYLGMVFHSTKGVHSAIEDRLDRARKGLFAMYQRLNAISRGRNIVMALHLFNSLVEPVLLYGSQVWAPDVLVHTIKDLSQPDGVNKLDHFFLGFLRHLVGLRKSVPVPMVFMELGQDPMIDRVLFRLIRFWNKLVDMPEDSWARKALFCEVQQIQQSLADRPSSRSCTSWSHSTLQLMLTLNLKPLSRQSKQPNAISFKEFRQKLQTRRLNAWLSLPDPDVAGHGQIKLSTYWHHFVDMNCLPRIWKLPIGFQKVSAVLRFRLGCHDLAIETGRWANIPRVDRHVLIVPGSYKTNITLFSVVHPTH
jgi:hypothetical protein